MRMVIRTITQQLHIQVNRIQYDDTTILHIYSFQSLIKIDKPTHQELQSQNYLTTIVKFINKIPVP